jgi:hypothetical protein
MSIQEALATSAEAPLRLDPAMDGDRVDLRRAAP